MKANGDPIIIRNPRVRDQSNAANEVKTLAKVATSTSETQKEKNVKK